MDQLLVGQVGERHHDVGLGQRAAHLPHEVDLRRLRLHDPLDQLLRGQRRRLQLAHQRHHRAGRGLGSVGFALRRQTRQSPGLGVPVAPVVLSHP